MQNEESRSCKLNSHISYLETYPFKVSNRMSKLLPSRGILDSLLKGRTSNSHHSSSNSRTFSVQLIQDNRETMVETPHKIFSWNTNVAKPQMDDISAPHA